MKHINIHIKIFIIVVTIGLLFVSLFNKYQKHNSEPYVKKTLTITITGYQYSEDSYETYFTVETDKYKSGLTIYEQDFVQMLQNGDLEIGDSIKIKDYCILEDDKLVYFKSSNEDIIEEFKDTYHL